MDKQTARYLVRSPLKWGGRRRTPGTPVDLDQAVAAPLLAAGVIEPAPEGLAMVGERGPEIVAVGQAAAAEAGADKPAATAEPAAKTRKTKA